MKFIKINKDEIPTTQQLAREIWNEHYIKILSQEQIDFMLDKFYSTEKIQSELENGVIWELFYENDEPVGYLVCEPKEERMYLSKIYLKASVRGKGYGKVLLNHAINSAKEHSKNALYLNVNKYNTASIEFYERNGFVKIDEGVFDIGNGYVMDDFILELKLN